VTVRGRFDVTGIVAGARAGSLAVKGFAGEVKRASGEQRQAFDAVGASAAVAGAAVVAGFGAAVKATMTFDKEMSRVGAVSGATGKELGALRQAAIDAGAATVFSATEAAQATSELAKAGISTADILGGALRGSLSLAAAGGLELADAATASAQAMNIFSLAGTDVGRIADVLASGANKSAADVADLAWSLRMGGQVAAQTGLTLEDTVGVLSAFADNALIGSDAGTSLKTMLQHLAAPADKTRGLMEELGVKVYDASGRFIGMEALAANLQKSLGGLTQEQRDMAMATIFGSDAVRGANVLYKIGAQGVKEYTDAVRDQGAAGRVAAQMMDNLAGDLEELSGAVETALIQGGSTATGVLRGLAQAATGAVRAFSALPEPVQGAATVVGTLVGAVTLLGGAMMIAVPKAHAYREALATAGPRTQALGRGLSTVGGILTGPWGLALAGATVALGVWATKHAEAQQRVAELRDTLNAQTGAFTADTRAKVVNRLETDGVLQATQKLRINMGDLVNATLGVPGALEKVNAQMAAARDRAKALDERFDSGSAAANEYALNANKVRGALDGTNAELRESVESWKRQDTATTQAATGAKNAKGPIGDLGAAASGLAEEVDDAADSLDDLKAKLEEIYQPSIAAFKATTSLKSGYRDLIGQLDAARGSMAGNTEASLRLRGAFANQLDTVADLYTATARSTGSVDRASKAVRDQLPVLYALAGRNKDARAQVRALAEATGNATGATRTSERAFLKTAEAMGISTARARKLWQELGKIKDRRAKVAVDAKGTWVATGGKTLFGGGRPLATGGPIPADAALGPGGPTSDDVPIWASVGEHMWTAAEVRAAGGHEAMLRMRSAAMRGEIRGYATGGPISFSGDPRPDAAVVGDVTRPITAGASQLVNKIADTYAAAWKKFTQSGGGVVAAARSQLGVPYSWGGGGQGGPSYGIGRGANIFGFDCSGLTEYAWWRGRGIGIGGVTYSQHPNTVPIGSPRPGALGFSSDLGHVVLASTTPGYVIEAPYTGARVREVRKSMPDWRWPKAAGMAGGGEVVDEQRLAERTTSPYATPEESRRARLLGLSGDPGGLGLPRYGTGGWVVGASGVDRVPIMATDGEYVVNAQAARANAALVEAINRGGYAGSMTGFGSISVGFRASGGQMSRQTGGELSDAGRDLKEAAKALRDVVSLRDGLDRLTGSILGQGKALMGYEAAWDAARASAKENGKTLNITTAKGRENRSALMGLAEAAHDVVIAMREVGKSPTAVVAKMKEQRNEFIKMARAMGLTAAQAKALADKWGLVPSKVKSILAKEASDTKYNEAAEKYNAQIEAKATGGTVAGGWTLVGEEGPELTWLPGGSHVVPAGRTAAMLAAGRRALPATGGGRSNGGPMHLTLKLGDRTLAELVVDPLRGYVRSRGGDVQAVLGR